MIGPCTCRHEGQDKLHGNGRRVLNLTSKENTYKCTVCGKESSHK